VSIKILESLVGRGGRWRDKSLPAGYKHNTCGRDFIHHSVMDILVENIHNDLKRNLMGKARSKFVNIKGDKTRVRQIHSTNGRL